MYRSTTSFTTTDYDVRPKQILEDDFTTQDEIQEFLRIGYIEIYDDTIDITENGLYDVEDYQNADVNVPSGEPTLQSKDITINQNGTTTVTADQGYDGLSDVDVTVSGILDTSDATATAGDIASGKTAYVNGVKLTGTAEEPSPDWSEIGYSDVPQALLDDFDYSKNIADNWNSSQTSLASKFAYNSILKYMPLVDTSNATKMSSMFKRCSNLTTIPQLDTSNVTSMSETFSDCTMLKSIPLLDTSNVTNMQKIFYGCTMLTSVPLLNTSNVTDMVGAFSGCIKLTSVPLFNTSNVTSLNTTFNGCTMLTSVPLLDTSHVKNMTNMFSNCSSLSNDSLNNILQMCINATNFTGTKTLKAIGLSQTQAETCQTLSNWDAFVAAGWSTGY